MLTMVIFDADGVLFDSDQSNIAFYNAIFERLGESRLTSEEERVCVYLSAAQVFALRADGDPARLGQMKETARSLDFAPIFRLLRPTVDLRAFLLELKQNYRLGLATNRSTTVPALLEHFRLTDVFDAVASTLDPVAPKPAPDLLKLCLERAGVGAREAVYVGDSPVDLEAAQAAGVGFIAVGSKIAHPHRVAALREIKPILERLTESRP